MLEGLASSLRGKKIKDPFEDELFLINGDTCCINVYSSYAFHKQADGFPSPKESEP